MNGGGGIGKMISNKMGLWDIRKLDGLKKKIPVLHYTVV